MIPKQMCLGCEDDFYNGKNPYGVSECWNRKVGRIGKYVLIHVDRAPPYLDVQVEQLPSCYQRKRFVKVRPEQIGKDGHWR